MRARRSVVYARAGSNDGGVTLGLGPAGLFRHAPVGDGVSDDVRLAMGLQKAQADPRPYAAHVAWAMRAVRRAAAMRSRYAF